MRDAERYETFAELRELPPHLTAPPALVIGALAMVAAGIALGQLSEHASAAHGIARSVFFAAAFLYLYMSLVDFWEHFRIEKILTGRYLAATFVPIGESINHGLTTLTVIAIFVLARPLTGPLEPRDYVLLALPGVFLFFGIRDELIYHRRRSYHREDILHTISHLSSGVMMTAFYPSALIDWSKLA